MTCVNTKEIFKRLSDDTGVSPEDVEKVLDRIGFSCALQDAENIISSNKIANLGANDIKASLRVAHTMVHA